MTHKTHWPILVGATFLILCAATCAQIPIDPSAQAAASNDETVIFQGAGAKSQKGYLFIQKREGAPITETLTLITPALNCKKATCAKYQFFRKDGTPGASGGIPKSQTSTVLNLSDLIGHTGSVTAADDGEYSAVIQLFYTDSTNHEHSILMNGFVRLNILSSDYAPVGCGDPAIAWQVETAPRPSPCVVQFTTAGRAVTCEAGCAE